MCNESGSPWHRACVESFKDRVREKVLNVEEFGSLTEPKDRKRDVAA